MDEIVTGGNPAPALISSLHSNKRHKGFLAKLNAIVD
jgi:hypothetical protein